MSYIDIVVEIELSVRIINKVSLPKKSQVPKFKKNDGNKF